MVALLFLFARIDQLPGPTAFQCMFLDDEHKSVFLYMSGSFSYVPYFLCLRTSGVKLLPEEGE